MVSVMSLPKNPFFAWSPSRWDVFRSCPLAYYYSYYLAWDGWDIDSEPARREAYLCKNLTSLSFIFNNAFRDEMTRIARAVQSGAYAAEPEKFSPEEVEKSIRARLNRAYAGRKNFRAWLDDPKRFPLIMECVYQGWGNPMEDSIEWIKEKLSFVHGYTDFKTFSDLVSLSKSGNGDKVIEAGESPFKSGLDTFLLDGVKVFSGVDLVYQKDGKTVAVNWRTGDDRESYMAASRAVALYLNLHYGIPSSDMVVRNEFLISGESAEYNPGKHSIDDAKKRIAKQAAVMAEFVKSSDTKENIPLSEDAFCEAARNPDCSWCRYRGICMKHKDKNACFFKKMVEETCKN